MEKHIPSPLSWSIALLMTLMFCVSAALVARQLAVSASGTMPAPILLPCSPGSRIEPLKDGLIYSDGAYLHALNRTGTQIWTNPLGSGGDFSVYDGGVAAWSGTMLSFMNAGGVSLYSGNMKDTVISAKLGTAYAAVLIGQEGNGTLVVTERGGRPVDSIAMPNQTVLDYGFYSGGNMLWVMLLDTEGTLPLSTISNYRPGLTLAGSITDAEQTVYHVNFQSDGIHTVGTIYARVYDYTGKEKAARRQLVYGWYLLDSSGGGNPLLAYAPISQEGIDVSDVRLIQGATDKVIRMPFPCMAIRVSGNVVYGFSEDYVMRYAPSDPKPVSYPLRIAADRLVGITDNRAAILVSGESVYLQQLP